MNRLLQHWSMAQAEHRPQATAIVAGGRSTTYGELERKSNQLAQLLRATGARRGDRVCLMARKSIEALVGMIGVLKADCAYVPIDPLSPARRAAQIINQCNSQLILAGTPANRALRRAISENLLSPSVRIGWLGTSNSGEKECPLEFAWSDLEGQLAEAPVCLNTSEDIAHILFTSGSTGVPKGVMITHSNVIHFISWALKYFGTSPEDRISCHPPLTFDLSTMDIYGTYAAGAQIHLVPPEASILPHRLTAFIRDSALTQWFSVPSILNHVIKYNTVAFHDFPALKRLIWCGERFPTPRLIEWMRRLPHVTFTNLYGPTEATIASSYYRLPRSPIDPTHEIPIGEACAGEELLVLDDSLQPVVPGEIGTLYIRGVGLSPGYWGDDDKTAEVFLRKSFAGDTEDRIYNTGDLARVADDGLVYLIGRADTQIKSRGYRIELGEIEAALHALEDVSEAAAVAVPTDGIETNIVCAAIVPAPGKSRPPARIREELKQVLPLYMVPQQWMEIASLPLNASGKTDRRHLAQLFADQISRTERKSVGAEGGYPLAKQRVLRRGSSKTS